MAEMLVGRSRAWKLMTEMPPAILRGNPVEPRRAHVIYRPHVETYRDRTVVG